MKMEAETTKSPHGNGAPSIDTCGICKEIFHSREPKLLPCLHSFCRSCIVPKANDNGIIKCPVCHQESALGDMIDNVLSIGRGNNSASGGEGANQEDPVVHVCTGCEESASASSYCTDCTEWLCDQCVQAHRRVRVTKDHSIMPKDKVVSNPDRATITPPLPAFLYCPHHRHEQLKLFCETCDKLTCRDCQLSEHKDHKYQFVSEASDQYKQFLNILLGKIKEKQTYIENAKALIKQRNSEIEEREKVVLNDIKNFAKTLMSEVNTRGKQLVADLHSVCQLKKSQLGFKHDAIVSLSNQLEHALKLTLNILCNDNTAVMLSTKKIVVHQLRHLLRTRCEVPNPYHVVDISLKCDAKSICSQIAGQGKLMVDGAGYGMSNQTPPVTKSGSRPLQPIAPKVSKGPSPSSHAPIMAHGHVPHNLANLTPEQRASLVKHLAAARLQRPPGSGSNSPTSTMTGPNLVSRPHRGMQNTPANSSGVLTTSSNNGQQGGRYPYSMMPQSNKVSSTQVVKTSGVFFPSSGVHPGSSKRRTLTVHEQLQQQRQQERYQQHLFKLKSQMDKMTMEMRTNNSQGPIPPAHTSASHSMTNPIIIQPSSSTGPYIPPHQTAFVSQSSGSREHLTPSPSRQTSPFSTDSRNDVSPAGSGSESGYNLTVASDNDSAKPSSSIRTEDFSHMIGPDGALCIKPEPRTPTSGDQTNSYPNQDDFLKMIQSDMQAGGFDPSMPQDASLNKGSGGLISDPSIETTQKTPPPGMPPPSNQDQPFNLCKPITDQVIDSQGDAAGQALDLSTGSSSATGSAPKPVLGTIYIQSTEPSGPLPLRDADDPSDDYCAVCHNGGQLLCCDTCPKVFHLTCHVPTLSAEPSGTWSCGLCTRDKDLRIEAPIQRPVDGVGSKRKLTLILFEEELRVCQRLLLELFTHEASLPFHDPVPKSVPNYHKIITQPMDLSTVKLKLSRQQGARYASVEEYLTDLQLIMSNCTKFNGTESEVGKAGVALEKVFHYLVVKYLPYFSSWVEGAHDSVLQEPKAKRRKRESGKEGKEGKLKEKHEGDKKDRRSPTVREKGKKQHEKMPVLLPPLGLSRELSREPLNDALGETNETGGERGDNILSNLGLVRNDKSADPVSSEDKDEEMLDAGPTDCGDSTEVEPADECAMDFPSDPVCDPNDESIDSSHVGDSGDSKMSGGSSGEKDATESQAPQHGSEASENSSSSSHKTLEENGDGKEEASSETACDLSKKDDSDKEETQSIETKSNEERLAPESDGDKIKEGPSENNVMDVDQAGGGEESLSKNASQDEDKTSD